MHAPAHRSIVRRHQAGGLLFTKTVFEPNTVLGRHTHANAYISFVRTGSYTERIGVATRRCEPMTVLFHAPGETHENRFHADPVQLLRVEAIESELLEAAPAKQPNETIRDAHSSFLCDAMLRELQAPDDLTSLALQGLAYELVAALSRRGRERAMTGPAWLLRIDALLVETFADPPELRAMARAVGVHPVTLARNFRRYRGTTVGARVRELRLEHACRLLAHSDAPLADIALECGFADQSHLSRLMRRRLGVSPARFRAAHSVPRR